MTNPTRPGNAGGPFNMRFAHSAAYARAAIEVYIGDTAILSEPKFIIARTVKVLLVA